MHRRRKSPQQGRQVSSCCGFKNCVSSEALLAGPLFFDRFVVVLWFDTLRLHMLISFQALLSRSLVFYLVWAGGGDPGRDQCSPIPGIRVSPQSATVDHQAAPSGNSRKFSAFALASPGCAAPMSTLVNVTWSVSDPTNVKISNAKDTTFGTATCLGPTSRATVTATLPASEKDGQPLTATAAITCK